MAYTDHSNWRERPGAVAAVIAIHAGLGYALVTGLSFDQIVDQMKNPQAIFIDPMPVEPPPPPPVEPAVEPQPAIAPLPYTPPSTIDLQTEPARIDTTDILLPPIEDVIRIVPTPGPTTRASASPSPAPRFDPVAAKPSNAPGGWVTQDDYRSSWINRGMDGLVSFKVTVGIDGRVLDCAVTRSSGHSQLDESTCANVSRRARFQAARDSTGEKITGTFSSTVKWQIPE